MTREPAYPGDPYNDPDYDEVAILKAEIERLRSLADSIGEDNIRYLHEIDRLTAVLQAIAGCDDDGPILARAALEGKP